MTFFVPRKSAQKSSSSVTSTTTTTTTTTTTASSPAVNNTTFRTVTKQVAPVTAQTTTSLSERQALAKQKLKKQRQQQQAAEDIEYEAAAARQRESLKRKKQQQIEKLKQDKGKGKQIDQDSEDDDGNDGRAAKQQQKKTKYTLVAVDQDDSDDLGTPVNERPNPLRVVRTDLAAPQDSLNSIPIIHGEDLVNPNLAAYVECALFLLAFVERKRDLTISHAQTSLIFLKEVVSISNIPALMVKSDSYSYTHAPKINKTINLFKISYPLFESSATGSLRQNKPWNTSSTYLINPHPLLETLTS